MGGNLHRHLFIVAVYASLSLLEGTSGSIAKLYRDSVDLVRTWSKNTNDQATRDMRDEYVQVIKQEVTKRHRRSSVLGCEFFCDHNVFKLQDSVNSCLNRLSAQLASLERSIANNNKQFENFPSQLTKEKLEDVPDFFSDADNNKKSPDMSMKESLPTKYSTFANSKRLKREPVDNNRSSVERFLVEENVQDSELPHFVGTDEDDKETKTNHFKTGRLSIAEDQLLVDGLRSLGMVTGLQLQNNSSRVPNAAEPRPV